MKNKILSICVVAAIMSSCSSAYRTSQTPDDVYYSPNSENRVSNANTYDDYSAANDDQYLRMKVQNRNQWAPIDDYDYWYDSRYFMPGYTPYNSFSFGYYNPSMYYSPFSYGYYSPYPSFGLSMGFGTYYPMWSPYSYCSPYDVYSPYSTIVYYKNPGVYYNSTTTNSSTTLGGYSNRTYHNTNSGGGGLLPRSNTNTYNTTNRTATQRTVTNNTTDNTIIRQRTVSTNTATSNNSSTSTRPVRTFNSNTNSTIRTAPPVNSSGGMRSTGSSSGTPRTPRGGGGN